MTAPGPGRIVHFRSRTGNYTVPAIVTANRGTLFGPAVLAGNIPAITEDDRVHLAVLTPGIPSVGRANAQDFVAPIPEGRPVGENLGGSYQEWDIPFWKPGDPKGEPDSEAVSTWGIYLAQPAGTWTWPPRV